MLSPCIPLFCVRVRVRAHKHIIQSKILVTSNTHWIYAFTPTQDQWHKRPICFRLMQSSKHKQAVAITTNPALSQQQERGAEAETHIDTRVNGP